MTNIPSRQVVTLKMLLGEFIGVPVCTDCGDKPKSQVIRKSRNLILRGASLGDRKSLPASGPARQSDRR